MKWITGAALASGLFLVGSYLLTPVDLGERSRVMVFDPAQPNRAMEDTGFRWVSTRDGFVDRVRRSDGRVTGRFRSVRPEQATVAVRWEGRTRQGFFLAPRLGETTLYRLSYDTGSQGSAITAYLQPADAVAPEPGP